MNINVKPIEHVKLSITNFRLVDGCIPCISYSLLLEENDAFWMVERRFREMEQFYKSIATAYETKCQLPPFPPRTFFPNTDKSFVMERKAWMEKCLQFVLQIPEIGEHHEVRDFFEFERADIVHRRDARNKACNDARHVSFDDRELNIEKRETELKLLEENAQTLLSNLQADHQKEILRLEEKQRQHEKEKVALLEEWEKVYARKAGKCMEIIDPTVTNCSMETLEAAVRALVRDCEDSRMEKQVSVSTCIDSDSCFYSAPETSAYPTPIILSTAPQPSPLRKLQTGLDLGMTTCRFLQLGFATPDGSSTPLGQRPPTLIGTLNMAGRQSAVVKSVNYSAGAVSLLPSPARMDVFSPRIRNVNLSGIHATERRQSQIE